MAGLTFDAGPLIAIERGSRRAAQWVSEAVDRGADVVRAGERGRGGPRSARLARLMTLCEIDELDLGTARRAGELLAAAGGAATLDAMLVASAAKRHDTVFTSDPDDVRPLAVAAGVRVMVL